MRYKALESIDFRYESIENHPKVLILHGFYGSGTGGREFESRHFDQKAKEEHLLFLGFFDGMTATMNSADVRRAYGGLACARMTKRTDYPDASGSSESRHFDQQKREMHRISLFCWFKLMGMRNRFKPQATCPPLTSSVRLVAELARRSRHFDQKAIGEHLLSYGFLYVANQGFFTVKFSTSATDAMAKRTAKGIA